MKLKNPPILEAWIELHQQGSESEDPWETGGLTEYLGALGDDFPEDAAQLIFEDRVEIKTRDPSTLVPKEWKGSTRLTRIRAFDESKLRCVQISQDAFVFNMRNQGSNYPGFDVLRDSALTHHDAYRKIFRPAYVRRITLHYSNRITIPIESGIARVEDYLQLGVSVPNDGWSLSNSLVRVTLSIPGHPIEENHLIVELATEGTTKSRDAVHFRVHWQAVADGVNTSSNAVLRERLRILHDAITARFREVATDKLWASFAPVEDS